MIPQGRRTFSRGPASTGYEIPREALKEWLHRGGKPAKLMRIARALPRSTEPVLDALEILAWAATAPSARAGEPRSRATGTPLPVLPA